MTSSHRVTLFFLLISLLILFSWNLQWDILEYIEADGDKENILTQKLERNFLKKKPCDLRIHLTELSHVLI